MIKVSLIHGLAQKNLNLKEDIHNGVFKLEWVSKDGCKLEPSL